MAGPEESSLPQAAATNNKATMRPNALNPEVPLACIAHRPFSDFTVASSGFVAQKQNAPRRRPSET